MKYQGITANDIETFFLNKTKDLSEYLANQPKTSKTKKYDMTPVVEAAQIELNRLVKKARMPDGPKPFWASFFCLDREFYEVTAKAGDVYMEVPLSSERIGRVQVKVGTPADNEFTQEFVWTVRGEEDGEDTFELVARNDNVDAIRHHIWSMADNAFRKAVKNFFEKKASQAEGIVLVPKGLGSWSNNPRPIDTDYVGKRRVMDTQKFKKLSIDVSKYLYDHKDVVEHAVSISSNCSVRTFVDVTGVVGVEPRSYCSMMVEFSVKRSKKHKARDMIVYHSAVSEDQLPSIEMLIREINISIASVMLSRKSKKASKYVGPAIMSSLVTGTFFHEIIGHRLESGRLLSKDETSVLLDAKDMTHDNLLFYDDPNISVMDNIGITGHFGFDEEGVRPERTVLTQHGDTINFLSTRTASKKKRHKSSGHARSDLMGLPEARMGVSVVSVSDESKTTSWLSMKNMLIQEIKKANLDYGVIILTCPHGETYINRQDIQSYRGRSEIMLRVFQNGKLEVMEPLDFIGVPLTSLKVVQAIGAEHLKSIENHGCGSSSGKISVSTVARPLLVSRIEMQPTDDDGIESPILERPKFIKE